MHECFQRVHEVMQLNFLNGNYKIHKNLRIIALQFTTICKESQLLHLKNAKKYHNLIMSLICFIIDEYMYKKVETAVSKRLAGICCK